MVLIEQIEKIVQAPWALSHQTVYGILFYFPKLEGPMALLWDSTEKK